MKDQSDRKSRVDVGFYVNLFENVLLDAYAFFSEIPSHEPERDMIYVRKRVQCEGLPFLTVQLPTLGKAVVQSLETGQLVVPPQFARWSKGGQRHNIPRIFSALFLKTFTPDGVLRPDGANSVGGIRHICDLCYKLQVPHTREAIETACQKYRDTDSSLAPLKPEQYQRPAFRYARVILSRLLRGFDPTLITPSHGPGAVAERLQGRDKYDFQYYSPEIDQLYPYYSFITYGCFAQTPELMTRHVALGRELPPSRVCMVPKDSRGPRVIAAEPALLQFLQQGLGRALVEYLESNPVTKGQVLFTDQTKHRKLAERSSVNKRYATLDLKDASDRVSRNLVELLFPESIRPYLLALRSPRASLPDGSEVKLQKYASMGSALCFPVEALTFWALAKGAMWAISRTRRRAPKAYVYGDDIIVPSAMAKDVIAELEVYGVHFNTSKCFISGNFRESCGMDAFRGEDVTPVRFKALITVDPCRRRAGLVAVNQCANALFDHGYWRAARYLDDYVEDWWGPIPTTIRQFTGLSRRSSVLPLGTNIPTGCRVRWNRTLQRQEVRTLKLKARAQRSLFPDWASRLGHNLSLGVPRPYSDEVAVSHSALPKCVWEALS